MTIERGLQMSVALVAALGACLLSMEQQTTALALIVSVGAAASVYVTDMRGWVDLPRTFSNLVALVALVLTLAQITRIGDGSDLLALANLLVYLQVVLMFQKKAQRDYWQIIALSLLQVVVAAALNLSMLFGVLLGFYFFASLAAMVMLFLYRESRGAPAVPARVGGTPAGTDALATLPLANETAASTFGDDRQAAYSDCCWRVLTIGLQTLLITVFIFFALPRLRGDEELETSSGAIGTTGMSAEVTLDDLERVLENPETVMRVNLVDGKSGKPFEFLSEPYLHGTIVIDYHDNGHWRYQHDTTVQSLDEPPADTPYVRQDIVVEPGRHPFLFSIAPAYRVPNRTARPELGIEEFSHQVTIKDRERTEFPEAFAYSLTTTSLRSGVQDPYRAQPYRFSHSPDFEVCTEIDRDKFPQLCATAETVLSSASPGPRDRLTTCRQLEAHFLRSGEYKYTLGRSPDRRFEVDPIEDFVGNHKSGHCEYFASALALMLRSQGIPSRLVLGYKGGEYNEPGKYFIVRQLHAHAWVEAYLPKEEALAAGVPAKMARHGVWMRLDPTPAGNTPEWEMPGIAWLNSFNQWMDYSQVVWNQYVLGMNSDRQREAVYQPILDRVVHLGQQLLDPLAWESFLTSLAAQFGLSPDFVRKAMAWFVTAVVLIFVIGMGSVIQMIRYLHHRWRRSPHELSPEILQQIPYYLQFEALMRRVGFARLGHQTPLEWATAASRALADGGLSSELSHAPLQIVQAYYRVRYGHEWVDAPERARLLASVRELRHTLLRQRKKVAWPN